MRSLPGWTTKVVEVSNNVYKVTLKDAYGRVAETTDDVEAAAIRQATSWAFDIEKQISKNWSKFLYDLCVQESAGDMVNAAYDVQAQGSWVVDMTDKRMVYDGAASTLILQTRSAVAGESRRTIRHEALAYVDVIAFIKG